MMRAVSAHAARNVSNENAELRPGAQRLPPSRLTILFVEVIEDQWYGPETIYFRIQADDGNTYVLGHDEKKDIWTLESFRSSASSGHSDSDLNPPTVIH